MTAETAEPEALKARFPLTRWLLPAVAVLQLVIIALLASLLVGRPEAVASAEPEAVDLSEITSKLDDIAADAQEAKRKAGDGSEEISKVSTSLAKLSNDLTGLGAYGIKCRSY